MKNLLLVLFVALSSLVFGQVPNMINYQGVARNSVGNVLPNKKLALRLSIREGDANGTIVYKETRAVTTNSFGLFTVAIGSPGADNVSGTISGIDWSNAAKFIQVEVDPEGGSNFINMGAAQLLSVPYSLYAAKAAVGTLSGAAGGDLSGSYPNPIIINGAITTNKLGDNSVTTPKIADGSVTSAKLAVGVIPTSLPPSGTAGGDLNGSYPNPTINNNAITTTKIADGSVTSAKLAAGVIPTSLPPSGTAGGDLNGSYPNPTINNGAVTTTKIADGAITNSKILDNAITTSKVADGSITLAKLGPDVILGSGGAPSGPAGGDLNGTYPNPTINNNSITTTKIADASVTSAKLAAGVIPTSLPPSGTAGGDLSGSYPNPTINDNAITTTKIADASVTSTKLAAGVIPTSLPPSGTAGGDLSGSYPNPTINSNAITTIKIADGSVTSAKLAAGVIPTTLPPNGIAGGDLSGSYPNPLVNKIQNIAVSNIAPANGQVLKFNGTQWVPATDDIGSGGGSNPVGPAGGDLSGSYPNPSIASGAVTTSKIENGAVITPKIANDAIVTPKIADGAVTSAKLAAGVIPTSLPPSGTAGGDLTGTYPNPSVNKILGVTVTTTGAANGQVLKFNGTSWVPGTDNTGSGGSNPTGPAGGDLTGSYPNPTINTNAITTTKIADASVTSAKLAAGVIPTSLPPTGTAGGDLTGSYPNPTINDNAITTIKIADASVTSAKLAAGVIPTSLPPTGTAGGDLNGTYPNPTLNKIQGVNVTATGAIAGQVLKFDGTSWVPGTDNSGSGGSNPTGPAGGDLTGSYPNPTINTNAITTTKIADGSVTSVKLAAGVIPSSLPPTGTASGDLSGSYPSPTVNKILGINVTTTGATTGQVLKFDGTSWVPGTDNSGSGGGSPTGPAGGDLTGSYPNPTINSGAVTTTKIADGSVTGAKLAAGVIPSSLPPTGAAGGDLTGSYPNPTITTNAITTTKIADGSVTSAKLAAGVIPSSLPPTGTASGDLSGSYPSPTVNKILGVTVNNTGLASGMVLKYNGTQWAPATDNTGSLSLPYSASANSASDLFSLTNTGTGAALTGISSNPDMNSIGVYGKSTGGKGVVGESVNGNAGAFYVGNVLNNSDAVYINNVGAGNGLAVESAASNGIVSYTDASNYAAVQAFNRAGGIAIWGITQGGTGPGVKGTGTIDGGTAVEGELLNGPTSGNIAVFKVDGTIKARIDYTGKGWFNQVTGTGADVAEAFDVEGNLREYEPGDILVISTTKDRTVERSSEPYSTLVAGVYATKPGVLLSEENIDNDLSDKVPMGVIGVIPTKVCLQGGAIKRGDLLVTSSIAGVAMKADPDKVKVGQVIGKALQDFDQATVEKINVLVSIK